jgi:hypothetical protein
MTRSRTLSNGMREVDTVLLDCSGNVANQSDNVEHGMFDILWGDDFAMFRRVADIEVKERTMKMVLDEN